MKTIVIYFNSINASGGIERVIANLINAWLNVYKIVLITKDSGKSFYKLPFQIEKISLNIPMNLDMHSRLSRIKTISASFIRSSVRLKCALRKIHYDYIYVASPLNLLEVYLAGINPQKTIVSEHSSAYGVNLIYHCIKRYLYPKMKCVSVPNSMDVDLYKKWNCKVAYISHLIPIFTERKPNYLNSKVVLNIGRLTYDKRQDVLIRIWSKIKNKNGWKLWIVGDGEEKTKLETLIKDLSLTDSVLLIPATKDIDSVYKQASIFAFTSRFEGFGMVLLEAMSYGIPCIAFDCPSGPRDIVKDRENGYLVENNNIEVFRQKLDLLINTKNLRKFGANAYLTIKNWPNDSIKKSWDRIFYE